MDREAWRAAIHGVAKSRTRLSDWTELSWVVPNFERNWFRQLPAQVLTHLLLTFSPFLLACKLPFHVFKSKAYFLASAQGQSVALYFLSLTVIRGTIATSCHWAASSFMPSGTPASQLIWKEAQPPYPDKGASVEGLLPKVVLFTSLAF